METNVLYTNPKSLLMFLGLLETYIGDGESVIEQGRRQRENRADDGGIPGQKTAASATTTSVGRLLFGGRTGQTTRRLGAGGVRTALPLRRPTSSTGTTGRGDWRAAARVGTRDYWGTKWGGRAAGEETGERNLGQGGEAFTDFAI
ncbi:unnamed protein product [Linum trigynum]|uniref:Uncharacterized protein n=1 Tax=Linum trigynum TaxID=586398 RepID=A0AAV2G0D3_9ROSI